MNTSNKTRMFLYNTVDAMPGRAFDFAMAVGTRLTGKADWHDRLRFGGLSRLESVARSHRHGGPSPWHGSITDKYRGGES